MFDLLRGPHAQRLAPAAVDELMTKLQRSGAEVKVVAGNPGYFQIHTVPACALNSMDSWQNGMDPGFDPHLRRDHVTEVWALDTPLRRSNCPWEA
ncbi:MAG: ChuX/HutX family heme-like substrate-binding protein [Pseudomonadota bacterium]